VRGIELADAMKNMDISVLRPREVNDVEGNKDQVLPTSNVQASGSHDQNQASTSGTQVQDQQANTSSHDQPSASNQM